MTIEYERAYAWRSGRIDFQPQRKRLPDGALPIACGPSRRLRRVIGSLACRVGWEGRLFVPGVSEAKDGDAAVDALSAFCRNVSTRLASVPERDRFYVQNALDAALAFLGGFTADEVGGLREILHEARELIEEVAA
jgi:hypothetical protein